MRTTSILPIARRCCGADESVETAPSLGLCSGWVPSASSAMSWRTVRPSWVVPCVHSCFRLSVCSESVDKYHCLHLVEPVIQPVMLLCERFQEDYHVHGDALGFLHLNHLPTICRKLRVEPSQQAEDTP